MKMVKIISGAYGHNVNARIEVKTRNSEPFALDDIEAQRLVDKGIAVIVGEAADKPAQGATASDPSSNPDTPENSAEGDSDADTAGGAEDAVPPYDVDTNVNELRSIAKTYCDGMTFPAGTTKAEMVAAIDEYLAEGSDSDAELELSAADPE